MEIPELKIIVFEIKNSLDRIKQRMEGDWVKLLNIKMDQ